jgi:hypothetical protein
MSNESSLTRGALEVSFPSQTARGEPPVTAALGNPIIGQPALSDQVSPLAKAPRCRGGILAELEESMGQFR